MTIGIVATLKVKTGKETEFETVFRDLQEAVAKNESGCLLYQVFKSRSQPSTYIVMEQYKSQADLDAHRTTPHMAAAGPKLGGVLDGRPSIELLDKV
ncbi:MAG: antibiotic biosynthesis monooxygenase [Alphaproteobacteria bacterium]|nr:antibiotic biosynthesis monooxygenase [Alphaproteobacteria bacterium]